MRLQDDLKRNAWIIMVLMVWSLTIIAALFTDGKARPGREIVNEITYQDARPLHAPWCVHLDQASQLRHIDATFFGGGK